MFICSDFNISSASKLFLVLNEMFWSRDVTKDILVDQLAFKSFHANTMSKCCSGKTIVDNTA